MTGSKHDGSDSLYAISARIGNLAQRFERRSKWPHTRGRGMWKHTRLPLLDSERRALHQVIEDMEEHFNTWEENDPDEMFRNNGEGEWLDTLTPAWRRLAFAYLALCRAVKREPRLNKNPT